MANEKAIESKLGKLIDAEPALTRLAQALLDPKTPMKFRYSVSKLQGLTLAERKTFFEQQESLIKEYGTERPPTVEERQKNGDAPITEVMPPDRPAYFEKLKELLETDVTLPWRPVDASVIEHVPLSSDDMRLLVDAGLMTVPADWEE